MTFSRGASTGPPPRRGGAGAAVDAGSGKLLATVEQTETKPRLPLVRTAASVRHSPTGGSSSTKPYDGDAFLLADAVTTTSCCTTASAGAPRRTLPPSAPTAGSSSLRWAVATPASGTFNPPGLCSSRTFPGSPPAPSAPTGGGWRHGGEQDRLHMGPANALHNSPPSRDTRPTWCGQPSAVTASKSSQGGRDNQALLWDASTGKTLALFSGHTAAVTHVAFSPDGRQVATGS